ncbi:hypothetical protein [Streptomyces capparidis]
MDTIELAAGRHDPGSGRASFMEAVSHFAGEAWSDRPECVSPLIAVLGRAWNDALPDADRTRLLRPRILRVAGTRCPVDLGELGVLRAYSGEGDLKDVPCMPADCARAWMCADWLIRTYTPTWLRLAGRDTAKLEELPELVSGLPGYERFPGTAADAVVMDAIVDRQPRAERDIPWLDFHACVSDAAAMTGGRAVRDAFSAVPWLAPGAPDSRIDHLVRVATANAEAAMATVVQAAARDAGWSDALEAEHLATLDLAREAARRARREVERAAPAEVRRAARDAKRAAPPYERGTRTARERATRRSAEAAVRHRAGRAVTPYVWIRAKAAGWAAVRDYRKAMHQYAPPAVRDAARAAAERAYLDVERAAPWQPALTAAQAAARRALAPTVAELQNSACDLLDRLTRA